MIKSLKISCIALILLFHAGCAQKKVQGIIPDEKKVSAVDFFSVLSLEDNAGEVINVVDDKESIYMYDIMVMYQVPVYSFISSNNENLEAKGFGADSSLPVSYNYVVFNSQKDSIGFVYASLSGPITDTISVNKFLSNGFRNFEKIFKETIEPNKLLINSRKSNDSIIEKFIPIIKLNKSYSDTTSYFYKKDYNDLKYSLVPELDSLRKMKLYKIVAVFIGNPESTDPDSRVSKELKIEFKKKEIKDPEIIISLFKRFEKDRLLFKTNKT